MDPITLANSTATLSIKGNTASIKVRKIDVDTNEPIPNTIFQLSREDGTVIGTATTDVSGTVIFTDLYQGTYNLKEIQNNDNYVLSSEITKVIAEYNKTTETQVTNEKKKGQVRVVKVDKDNNEIKLAGVEFNVLDSKGNVVDKLITDANGEAISKRLPVNESYILQETKTLENYVLNTEKVTVTLKDNQITDTVFSNEKKKGQIKVVKIDEDYNEIKLPNVEFDVFNSKGEIVDKLITNANGEAVSKMLPIDDTYTVRERKTLINYILNDQPITVTLKQNEISSVEFGNKHKEGNLQVYKVDKDNNKIGLGNIEFDLYSEEFKKVIGTYTTDVNGEIFIKNLRVGSYQLIEKITNKWYNLNDEAVEIKINWGKITDTLVENELKKGQVKVIKRDFDNNEIKLEGVKFDVLDEKGTVLETIITDEKGEAFTSKYPVRDYEKLIIREVKTLKDYVLQEVPQTIELKANEITTAEFTNELEKGQIKVIKIDEDNNEVKLQGVKFNIYDNENNLIQTIVTDKNGEAITDRLPINKTYTVKEIETNKNYALNEKTVTVVLKEDEIKDIIVENEKKKGQIQVIKIDTDNNEIYIPDVTFEVYNSKNQIVDTITTDETGKATTKRLPIDDTYTIKETISNELYVLTEEIQTVILKENEIKDVIFENEKKKGQIEVVKIDTDNNEIHIPDVTFEVYNSKNEIVDTITTDEFGKAVTKKLPIDDEYTVKETISNELYVLTDEVQKVTLEENEIKSIIFENEKKKGQIEVIKIDSEDNEIYIPGVTFEVYNSENEVVDTITTDEEGKAITKRLPIDDEYTVKEIISNEAYVLTEETQTVVLEEDEIKNLTFENTKKYGQLKITKLSSKYSKILDLPANSPIPNTKFLVVNEKGEAMGLYTTDETGSVLTSDLPYGKYTVYEYEVPEHFLKDAEPQEISITEDNQVIELTFKNSPKESELPKTGF